MPRTSMNLRAGKKKEQGPVQFPEPFLPHSLLLHAPCQTVQYRGAIGTAGHVVEDTARRDPVDVERLRRREQPAPRSDGAATGRPPLRRRLVALAWPRRRRFGCHPARPRRRRRPLAGCPQLRRRLLRLRVGRVTGPRLRIDPVSTFLFCVQNVSIILHFFIKFIHVCRIFRVPSSVYLNKDFYFFARFSKSLMIHISQKIFPPQDDLSTQGNAVLLHGCVGARYEHRSSR